MTQTYRDATGDDAPALEHIFKTSFCDTFAHLYRREDLVEFLSRYSVASWKKDVLDPNVRVRIAEVDAIPAGYVKLGPMKLPVTPSGPAMLLDQLYIVTDYHGSGIAHKLMDWALDECAARDLRELYLSVYTDNERAKRFYERYGFQAVGRYDFMVGNHADEDIIMRKAL